VSVDTLSPPGSEVLGQPLQRAVLTRPQLGHQTAPAGAHGVGEAPADIIRPPPSRRFVRQRLHGTGGAASDDAR